MNGSGVLWPYPAGRLLIPATGLFGFLKKNIKWVYCKTKRKELHPRLDSCDDRNTAKTAATKVCDFCLEHGDYLVKLLVQSVSIYCM